MYTFRKFRKNAKALSPVVASIILIAVTVAVSIAVAAWMGTMSTQFMQTEQIRVDITGFTDATHMTANVTNGGTSTVSILRVEINGEEATMGGEFSLAANAETNKTVAFASGFVVGGRYQVTFFTAQHEFSDTITYTT